MFTAYISLAMVKTATVRCPAWVIGSTAYPANYMNIWLGPELHDFISSCIYRSIDSSFVDTGKKENLASNSMKDG